MKDKNKIVLVGAGINGLVMARLLQKRGFKDIHIIEGQPEPGGLFRSCNYDVYGVYDYGIHVFQDTGVPELEAIIRSALPEHEWDTLKGNDREIAGLYFNGRLQKNTAFLDLRDTDLNGFSTKSVDFYRLLNTAPVKTNKESHSFYEEMKSKYGSVLSEKFIFPIAESLYGKEASELNSIASTLTPFHRIVLFDEQPMLDLMKSSRIRDVFGYPEQRNLPSKYSSGLDSYYPKYFGLQKVIDSLVQQFLNEGGHLTLGARINNLEINNGAVVGLSYDKQGTRNTITNLNHLIWTASLPALYGSVIGNKMKRLEFDPLPETCIVNISLTVPPPMSDLYFFYSYLPGGNTYRVSNPANYCSGESRPENGLYPLCAEALFDRNLKLSDEEMLKKVLAELIEMKMVSSDSIAFSKLEKVAGGFPMPTLKNAASVLAMRNRIAELNIKNLVITGSQSTPDLFYYRDVLRYGREQVLGYLDHV